MQRVELRDAVNAEHYSLAIEHKLPMSVLQRGLDDPGIPIGPVVTASGDQARAAKGRPAVKLMHTHDAL
jgi:hypothetical protein